MASQILEPKAPPEPVASELSLPSAKDRIVAKRAADVTLEFVELHGESYEVLTEEAERKLKLKLYLSIIGLVVFINLWLFVRFSSESR